MQLGQLKRREFITLLGGSAAWPLVARAQQSAMPVIGFLGTVTPSTWGPWTASFMQRLHELGWIEGRNVTIEVRWAEGRYERFAEIAAEFVRLKVDVIVTSGGASLRPSRPHRSSRLCSRWRGTRLAPAWLRTLHDRAAMSPACRFRRPILLASDLMSYGANISDLLRRAADFVDKILRGATAGDIPVEQATKFNLIVNLTTAKALGLTMPESFLLRADEVIE
jgi:ABC-type uncharacterized transport system substrate-binding protein